jgi:hypothetical protein
MQIKMLTKRRTTASDLQFRDGNTGDKVIKTASKRDYVLNYTRIHKGRNGMKEAGDPSPTSTQTQISVNRQCACFGQEYCSSFRGIDTPLAKAANQE